MALLTLAEYKTFVGLDPTDTRNDARIGALLDPVTRAIEIWTARDFSVSAGVALTRTFQYDGSGFLDIDDAVSVTGVTVNVPNADPYVMDSMEWTAMPDNGPVVYYLLIHGGVNVFGISPEMGFERNLDQYPMRSYKPNTLTVTATWGWPEVPSDVKLATAWTIQDWTSKASAENLTAEAIEGYSRSWGAKGGGSSPALAIPNRARDILAAYQRIEF